jgi:hypothetical protein
MTDVQTDSCRDLVPFNDSLTSDSDTEINSSQECTFDTRPSSKTTDTANEGPQQQPRKKERRKLVDKSQGYVEQDLIAKYNYLIGTKSYPLTV